MKTIIALIESFNLEHLISGPDQTKREDEVVLGTASQNVQRIYGHRQEVVTRAREAYEDFLCLCEEHIALHDQRKDTSGDCDRFIGQFAEMLFGLEIAARELQAWNDLFHGAVRIETPRASEFDNIRLTAGWQVVGLKVPMRELQCSDAIRATRTSSSDKLFALVHQFASGQNLCV